MSLFTFDHLTEAFFQSTSASATKNKDNLKMSEDKMSKHVNPPIKMPEHPLRMVFS